MYFISSTSSAATETVSLEIRSATSSMTSVPKPLKFLRPHYGTLKSFFETMPESDLKVCMNYRTPSCTETVL
jgi:hypothetical protein